MMHQWMVLKLEIQTLVPLGSFDYWYPPNHILTIYIERVILQQLRISEFDHGQTALVSYKISCLKYNKVHGPRLYGYMKNHFKLYLSKTHEMFDKCSKYDAIETKTRIIWLSKIYSSKKRKNISRWGKIYFSIIVLKCTVNDKIISPFFYVRFLHTQKKNGNAQNSIFTFSSNSKENEIKGKLVVVIFFGYEPCVLIIIRNKYWVYTKGMENKKKNTFFSFREFVSNRNKSPFLSYDFLSSSYLLLCSYVNVVMRSMLLHSWYMWVGKDIRLYLYIVCSSI